MPTSDKQIERLTSAIEQLVYQMTEYVGIQRRESEHRAEMNSLIGTIPINAKIPSFNIAELRDAINMGLDLAQEFMEKIQSKKVN